ncbi:Interferon-induced GTP-binding Mx1-like protein [Cladobotryum mycophilum]|uniref:Interferon-induced GTP-binding Mx1-like protein n=1 Tax=Cladobotryum mycophilum TaxID=491253 RepID=A0ABR0T540_9HYPO
MGDDSSQSATSRLRSLDELAASHAGIFDAVDSLRDAGLEQELIPKLVVIGDQKSGKSSVLEAISQIPFPVHDDLCTRFPTELVLRKSDDEGITLSISVAAARSGRSALSDKRGIFSPKIAIDDETGLAKALREASDLILGKTSDATEEKRFSKDILRIVISGPRRYPLTLVDLPGLFRSETGDQSSEDRAFVEGMVRQYMAEPRNALLLIVSAGTPYTNLLAPDEIRKSTSDSLGNRVLGIITRVDNPNSTRDVLRHFEDQDPWKPFYGWHCLRNRTQKERAENANRDEMEAIYFRDQWKTIGKDCKGINTLMPRLTRLLAHQIGTHLTKLMADGRREIVAIEHQLSRLQRPRLTPMSQLAYLSEMATQFVHLACNAINGHYGSDMPSWIRGFFNKIEESDQKLQDMRLQAVVRAMTQIFNAVMILKGKTTKVLENGQPERPTSPSSRSSEDEGEDEGEGEDEDEDEGEGEGQTDDVKAEQTFQDAKSVADDETPYQQRLNPMERHLKAQMKSAGKILRESVLFRYESFPAPITKSFRLFEAEVTDMATQFRGTEGHREVNPELLSQLFRRETSRWREISVAHLHLVWEAVERFVDLALEHCVDPIILPDLRRLIIDKRLEMLRCSVEEKLEELLDCHDGINPAFHDVLKSFESESRLSPQRASLTTADTVNALVDAASHGIPAGSMDELRDVVLANVSKGLGGSKLTELISDKIDQMLFRNSTVESVQEELEHYYRRDRERIAVRRATDTLDDYYHVSLKAFSGYVSALVIQNGLLKKVPFEIFTSHIVAQQDGETIAKIAGEKQDDAQIRADCEARMRILKKALDVFEEYRRNLG